MTQPISGVSFGGGDAALRATPNVADSNVRPSVETPSDVATVASVPSPVYANMGQRFVAYFADLVLVYLIVFSVYVLAGALRMSFSNDEGIGFYVIFYLSLFIYMVAAQTAYHTTVGKYIQGLEVRSERQKRMYPSFWQVLLRETIGRVLASILWGAGYWTAINKPKKQAWSDAIAGTVVTVRQRNRALRRALTAFVVVAFIVDVSAIGYGLYKEDQGKRIAAYKKEVESTTTDVENARQAVDSKLSETSSGNSSDSFILFQNRMMSLKPDLDRYEAQLDRIQSLLRRVDSERVMETENERVYYVTLRKVYEVRKRQAEKLRQEADLVINSDGAAASVASLRKDLQFLDSDIEGLNQEASRLLEQIGVK